jgi:hypothetical protein
MNLNIKNDEIYELVKELAVLKGLSLTSAVKVAVRKELEREKAEKKKTGAEKPMSRYALLMEFADECSSRMKDPIHSWEIGDYLYDKDGLPK